MRVADKLSRIELADFAHGRVRLGDLWRDRPVVLAFVRHFG